MLETIQNQKREWFPIAIGAAFIFIALFSVYFEIRQSYIESAIQDLTNKKAEMETQLKANKIETGDSALNIKKQLEQIETTQLNWSKIIEKIEANAPKTIAIRSYNGSEEGIISASAVTKPDSPDPFADVARLVTSFNSVPSFKHVFVPSISKSLTPEGKMVLSFSVNFQYQKQNF